MAVCIFVYKQGLSHFVALPGLGLSNIDQADFELTESCLPLPFNARFKGMSHHAQLNLVILNLLVKE